MKKPNFFKYIEFLQDFQKVRRQVLIASTNIMENDVEHSYQLAMTAWYFTDQLKLKLSMDKLFKYALAHDLVEVYAGDTDPHIGSKKMIDSKEERESKAAKKIQSLFPSFKELNKTIKGYHEKKDMESKVVFILDKILPITNEYLYRHSKNSYYIKNKFTQDRWMLWINSKIASANVSEVTDSKIFKEVIEFINSKESVLFYKGK